MMIKMSALQPTVRFHAYLPQLESEGMSPVRPEPAMDPRWKKIEEGVCNASEMPSGNRSAWLDQFCEGDAELRSEIESLLISQQPAEGFLEHSVAPYAGALMHSDGIETLPETIGQYRVLREIGRGGMGIVYLAEREDDIKQRVAIKLVKRGLDTDEILQRFRNERQILASLNHPSIAKLFDGGITHDGRPYFVMEYIEGRPLTTYCDEHALAVEKRLHLFQRACSAVQHAHQNLIVHRDIKPSNILVTAGGDVKLLDFGVAKLLSARVDADATMTRVDQRMMTPQYASPEQIRGQRVTTATDVYSLGVVLYELLTSVKPYKVKDVSPEELSRAICETEPTKPSEAKSSAAAGGFSHDNKPAATAGGSDLKSLRGDLDNIVLMALRKDPERRYKSVEQFSEDIKRHLNGLPVIARKDTFTYRAAKLVSRNRLAATASLIVLLAIVTGLIVSIWQARVAARERNQARQEQAKAEQLNKFLQSILSAATPEDRGKDAKVIDVLNDAAQRINTEFAGQPALKAQALFTIGATFLRLGQDTQAEAVLTEALQLNSSIYGSDSKEVAACKIELGLSLLNKNQIAEAERILREGTDVQRRVVTATKSSAESRELAWGLGILGELYVRKLEHEKAKPLLQEAISIYDSIEGVNNEDSALVLISLGRAHQFSGDLAGAESPYQKSVAAYRSLPPRFDGRKALALVNLGTVMIAKGNFDSGVAAMREAHDIFQRQGDLFDLFEAKTYLCSAFFNHNDYKQSINEGQPAIDLGHKLAVSESADFLNTLKFVGLAYTRTGAARDGDPLLRENLALNQKLAPQRKVFVPST